MPSELGTMIVSDLNDGTIVRLYGIQFDSIRIINYIMRDMCFIVQFAYATTNVIWASCLTNI